MSFRDCPVNKIYNPDTGKCVNLNSKMGMIIRLAELEHKLTGKSDIDLIKDSIESRISELESSSKNVEKQNDTITTHNKELEEKLDDTIKKLEKCIASKGTNQEKYEAQIAELSMEYESNLNIINNLKLEKLKLEEEMSSLKAEHTKLNTQFTEYKKIFENRVEELTAVSKCKENEVYVKKLDKCEPRKECKSDEWYSVVNNNCNKINKIEVSESDDVVPDIQKKEGVLFKPVERINDMNENINKGAEEETKNITEEGKEVGDESVDQGVNNEVIAQEPALTSDNNTVNNAESNIEQNTEETSVNNSEESNVDKSANTTVSSPPKNAETPIESEVTDEFLPKETTKLDVSTIENKPEAIDTNVETLSTPTPNPSETIINNTQDNTINNNNNNNNKNKLKQLCKPNEYYNFKLKKCLPKICPEGTKYDTTLKKCV